MSGKAGQQQQGRQRPGDFSVDYLHKLSGIKLIDGSEVVGVITEASKYWFKVLLNGGEFIYVNKKHVIYVKPRNTEGLGRREGRGAQ